MLLFLIILTVVSIIVLLHVGDEPETLSGMRNPILFKHIQDKVDGGEE